MHCTKLLEISSYQERCQIDDSSFQQELPSPWWVYRLNLNFIGKYRKMHPSLNQFSQITDWTPNRWHMWYTLPIKNYTEFKNCSILSIVWDIWKKNTPQNKKNLAKFKFGVQSCTLYNLSYFAIIIFNFTT